MRLQANRIQHNMLGICDILEYAARFFASDQALPIVLVRERARVATSSATAHAEIRSDQTLYEIDGNWAWPIGITVCKESNSARINSAW